MLEVIKSLTPNMSLNFKSRNSLVIVTADSSVKGFYTVTFKEKLAKTLVSGKEGWGYSFLTSKCMKESNLLPFIQRKLDSGFVLDKSFTYLD